MDTEQIVPWLFLYKDPVTPQYEFRKLTSYRRIWDYQNWALLALYNGNQLLTGGFPLQKSSNAEKFSYYDVIM